MKNTITVCDKCLTASCWQGVFLCHASQNAGTVEKTEVELRALALEHPSYWAAPEDPADQIQRQRDEESGIEPS